MLRKQSVEQLLIRDQHPEWTTAQGRVLDEAQRTLVALARGNRPDTVLGGLIVRGIVASSATTRGRSIGEIAAASHSDPGGINHRGDSFKDVLEDLIEVGWVQEVDEDNKSLDAISKLEGENLSIFRHFKLTLPVEVISVE